MAKSKSRSNTSSSSSSSSSSSPAPAAREPNSLVRYYHETRAELRKVVWPTRDETRNLTTIIVIVAVAMAIFLGTLDYIFQTVAAGVIGGDVIRIGVAVILFVAGAAAFYFNNQEQ